MTKTEVLPASATVVIPSTDLKRAMNALITDVNNAQTSAMAQSTIFAMMDQFGNIGAIQFFNHIPGGCNVLFMDGHVDWVPYVPPSPGTDNTATMDLGANQPVLPSLAGIIGLF